MYVYWFRGKIIADKLYEGGVLLLFLIYYLLCIERPIDSCI